MNAAMLAGAEKAAQLSANDNEQLIVRAQSGDEQAFGAIVELHSRFVYKFVYSLLGDTGAAEELTQETFLAAYRNINHWRFV